MARKQRESEALTGARQLAERIRGFRTGTRSANPALDALTGKRAVEEVAVEIARAVPTPKLVEAAPVVTAEGAPQPASPPPLLRRFPSEPAAPPAPQAAHPADDRSQQPTAPPGEWQSSGRLARYSVYLGSQDIQHLEYIASYWPGAGGRSNRSELIRTAIHTLARIIEQAERDAGFRPTAPTGDHRDDTSR